ncbi:MAG TPA: hypothetical protein VLA16_09565 [Ideonella sp.]|nr:hypothetical protein [Ideonella sp.]
MAGELRRPGASPPELQYTVARDGDMGGFMLARQGQPTLDAADLGELLFLLEKDITVALQQRRPDLLFFHAAALEHGGKVYLLAGDSGQGKSTTAWGLLHHGFRYLSDELAPVEPASLLVHGYPHALCMKRRPPAACPLPVGQVLDLCETLHVPVAALPAGVAASPSPLAAILFVQYDPGLQAPSLQAIGAAEAAARLYVSTLNALAHPAHGLDAVLRVAQGVPCFVLHAAELGATCELVGRMADG